jgi:hypothetical protein
MQASCTTNEQHLGQSQRAEIVIKLMRGYLGDVNIIVLYFGSYERGR